MKNPWLNSWKKCTFAQVFRKKHDFLLLNFSDELQPQTRFNEQIQIHIEAAHHSADFNHSVFGAVAGLSENMDGACAFFMPIRIVLPPTRL